jgi:hypothetical protein
VWALVLGGCGVALVLVAGLSILAAISFFHNFQAGRYSCLPADFPIYPGASYQRVNSFVGTGGNQCQVVLDATASSGDVEDYYQGHLGTGKWKILGYDANQGVLSFGRSDSTRVHGTIGFLGHGSHTQLDIEVDT